jgi:hypothetical protein
MLLEVLSVPVAVAIGVALQPLLLEAAAGNRVRQATAGLDAGPLSDAVAGTRHRVR